MLWKSWWTRLVLGSVLFFVTLACQSADMLTAQLFATATPTRTRTVRPTFTPVPTATTVPSPTPPPTPVPTATRTPTRRPTPRPPTPVPPPPVAPQPTAVPAPSFPYAANPPSCTHAGNQYIKGRIYDSKDPGANGVAGIKVAMGGADGSNAWVTITSEWDGFYTFTLTSVGQPANAGTYYIWLEEGNRRISDIGGPIKMNPVGPDAPGTCWAGSVDFWRR